MREVVSKRFSLAREIAGIMWRGVRGTFVSLCFCSFLLLALTHEAMFGRKLPKAGRFLMEVSNTSETRPFPISSSHSLTCSIAGHGFYDENEYDDGYAEYTGEDFYRTVLLM